MSYSFFNSKTVTTRRPHTCEQCRRSIPAGESCEYGAGLFEGNFMSYYEHTDCREAWQEVQREALSDEGYAPFLADEDDLNEAKPFLTEKYPAVAARLWPAPPTTLIETHGRKE